MKDQLLDLLQNSAPGQPVQWLEDVLSTQRTAFQRRPFYYAFSGTTRHFDKSRPDTAIDQDGFTTRGWTCDQIARTLLLVTLAEQPRELFLETLNALLETADMRESAAIFAAFPLLPEDEALVPLARDGLRTNITSVFDAIALDNPWPSRHFDDEGWNQMVLKAFFMSRPIYRIQGLETRANPALAAALSNYAHERWAAGRPVSPELWHACHGQLSDTLLADLARVITIDQPGNREAVALLLHADDRPETRPLRDQVAGLFPAIAADDLTWETVGRNLESAAS